MQLWHVHKGEAYAFLRELADESVDALVTDPPYSSGGFMRSDRVTGCASKYQRNDVKEEHKQSSFSGDNRDQRGFMAWATLWLSEACRVLKTGAPVVLFTDWRQLPVMTDALQAGGFVWRGVCPWTKTNPRPRKGGFPATAEFVVWGSKGELPARDDVGCLKGAWHSPTVHHTKRVHLTEKPLEVMREVVRICPPGGVVLDLFAGSGSTGVAAFEEGRSFLGCELSDEYHATAVRRMSEIAAARA